MAMVTLGEAARLTGLGKTTLARAIKAGRLRRPGPISAAIRSTPPSLPVCTPSLPLRWPLVRRFQRPRPNATGETPSVTAALEVQIAGLREVSELLRRQLDDV